MKADVLIEQILRLHSLYESIQKQYISLNGTLSLTTGEIHLIEAIGKHPAYNVSELGISLGITKGAVSQMALRLEKKKLITKVHEADNGKNILLRLSPTGKQVFTAHQKFHAAMYAELEQYPEALEQTKKMLDVLERYLNHYKEMIDF